jgi:excinuclease ABC subunit C
VGAKRRHALLSYFGGMQGLLAASVDAIAKVPGISQTLARQIFEHFHPSENR